MTALAASYGWQPTLIGNPEGITIGKHGHASRHPLRDIALYVTLNARGHADTYRPHIQIDTFASASLFFGDANCLYTDNKGSTLPALEQHMVPGETPLDEDRALFLDSSLHINKRDATNMRLQFTGCVMQRISKSGFPGARKILAANGGPTLTLHHAIPRVSLSESRDENSSGDDRSERAHGNS